MVACPASRRDGIANLAKRVQFSLFFTLGCRSFGYFSDCQKSNKKFYVFRNQSQATTYNKPYLPSVNQYILEKLSSLLDSLPIKSSILLMAPELNDLNQNKFANLLKLRQSYPDC